MKVAKYIEIFKALSYPELFSNESLNALKNIQQSEYGELNSSGALYETVLDKPVFTADFSCRLYDEILKYYWLEFDYENYSSPEKVVPCVFLENVYRTRFFPIDDERKMHKFFGREKFERVKQPLQDLTKLLESSGARVINLGNLDSRGEKYYDYVRIETRAITARRVVEILQALSYTGDLPLIENTLSEIEPYTVNGIYNISFENYPDRISDKVGIYFYLSSTLKNIRDAMSVLVAKKFCLPEKAGAIINWRRSEIPKGLYFQEVNHIKFTFERNLLSSAKVYLSHSDEFKIFS